MSLAQPAPAFEIQPVTEQTVPQLLALVKKLAEFEKLSDAVVADEDTFCESLFGEKAAAEALLGAYQGEPVAFAIYFMNFSSFIGRHGLYIEDIFVEAQYRGMGFGKAMFLHLARQAVHRNCGRMEWSVLDWNHKAIDFYESFGAVALDQWTVYRMDQAALSRLKD